MFSPFSNEHDLFVRWRVFSPTVLLCSAQALKKKRRVIAALTGNFVVFFIILFTQPLQFAGASRKCLTYRKFHLADRFTKTTSEMGFACSNILNAKDY